MTSRLRWLVAIALVAFMAAETGAYAYRNDRTDHQTTTVGSPVAALATSTTIRAAPTTSAAASTTATTVGATTAPAITPDLTTDPPTTAVTAAPTTPAPTVASTVAPTTALPTSAPTSAPTTAAPTTAATAPPGDGDPVVFCPAHIQLNDVALIFVDVSTDGETEIVLAPALLPELETLAASAPGALRPFYDAARGRAAAARAALVRAGQSEASVSAAAARVVALLDAAADAPSDPASLGLDPARVDAAAKNLTITSGSTSAFETKLLSLKPDKATFADLAGRFPCIA